MIIGKDSSRIQNAIPVLVTWDVDPDQWHPPETRIQALKLAMELCDNQGITSTFFFTADSAGVYVEILAQILSRGHEIGCHGLTHGSEEDYDRMPADMQRQYIKQATDKLQALVQVPIRSFRSPRVKISATTLNLLAEFGYKADSSVCSQRVDLVSSNLVNVGWLYAPRRPYHPHEDNAYRRGNIPIWEIPISALILPFISSTMFVLGLPIMKMLFRVLYAESKHTGKPILYLAHPTEFVRGKMGKKGADWKRRLRRETAIKYLRPSYVRVHGLRLRRVFYEMNIETRIAYTKKLFTYMASFPGVAFMTVNEYADQLAREEHRYLK